MLELLLMDLRTLERDGLFVPGLGKVLKGTVACVVADNLGAHSVAGFVEAFLVVMLADFVLLSGLSISQER